MKSETRRYIDRASGVEVTQLTDHKGHSHHFYFTNAGWYADGHYCARPLLAVISWPQGKKEADAWQTHVRA